MWFLENVCKADPKRQKECRWQFMQARRDSKAFYSGARSFQIKMQRFCSRSITEQDKVSFVEPRDQQLEEQHARKVIVITDLICLRAQVRVRPVRGCRITCDLLQRFGRSG